MRAARSSLALVLALVLVAPPARAEEPMTWTPEALESTREDARGAELGQAQDYAAAYEAYYAAYKAMPDPIRYHRARDWVFGSMRSSLISLYETTGEVKYLCQVRRILLEHLEELMVAFGEDAEIPDVPGIRRRLQQVDEDMRAHVPKAGEKECVLPTMARTPAPRQVVIRTVPVEVPKLVPAPPSPRSRGMLVAGATGLAVGSALLGFMTYALVSRRAAYEGLRELDATAEGPLDPVMQANADALRRAGQVNYTAAITTGISGGALVLAGIGLVAGSRGRGRRTAAGPVVSSGLTGLVLHTQF
ncbi:hypothetical protein [Nannocystis punicea]|uniref:Uncharacterized protein n=1 Tax=Nannocystis punicea TaxID=2995304 RepID=A0ABY7H5Z0_9BACT|nr:hypothetical protein [Nannocystis poenicansa]WAS94517.1 hypothetical protein O0S08_00005 [Nannocystis poenicansa]